ncbi:MAG: hypothetical protein AB7L13_16350 [Acidimicrobiia bacterium]
MADRGDVGWGNVRTIASLAVVPKRRTPETASRLVGMRMRFVATFFPLLLTGVLVAWLTTAENLEDSIKPVVATAIVVAYGLLTYVIARFIVRDLPLTSAKDLAEAYMRRFHLRLAFTNSTAMMAFVMTIVSGSALPYVVGLVITVARLVAIAPTDWRLQADQADLVNRGSALDLGEALRQPTAVLG